VIRAGRYGEYLACANFPEHKETRPLSTAETASDAPAPDMPGVGETCPECGAEHGGVLGAKRGRFGPFVGCSRYPDCKYIHKTGPPPPAQLPFEVTCPLCGQGHLATRRARRTGSLFWGCSRYPKCRFTTSNEPVGALHETDEGPIARKGEGAICMKCGAAIELPEGDLVGRRLAGGPPDPQALAKPGRGGRRGAAASDGDADGTTPSSNGTARRRTTRATTGRGATSGNGTGTGGATTRRRAKS
jgi:ssDNA-binding Zn-finger/Zn-ribbon topoisomerase 1